MPRRAVLVLVPLLLAACGGFANPDLATGVVEGRIVGASLPAARVYPLGRPDLVSVLAGDGTFRVTGVPVETQAMVLYDGKARAQLEPVVVRGASLTRLPDRFGDDASVSDSEKMPLAGTVLAAAHADGGALSASAEFTVDGTDAAAIAQTDLQPALLTPLPEGSFDLSVVMPGFLRGSRAIAVVSGQTVAYDVYLDIDETGEPRGCAATGGCRNDMKCNEGDGRCYQCLSDGDCSAGVTCDPATHLCLEAAGGGAAAPVCAGCAADGDCGASEYCLQPEGYCSRACATPGDCQAGFDCQNFACIAVEGCSEYLATMGSSCLTSEACNEEHGIRGGVCFGADSGTPTSGYCTAPCAADADCPVAFVGCDQIQQLCVK